MKSKSLRLVGILILAGTNLFAQGIRIPGYIIKADGDTLRGFIVDRKDNWHVNEIEFSSSERGATEKYPVPSIKGFYVETYNVFYKSAVTEIDIKPVDLDHLEPHSTRNLVVDTLLLERIATGPINLYRYEGKRNKRHFFVEKNGVLSELPFVRYQGPSGVNNANTYRYELRTMTSDCDKQIGAPDEYNDSQLIKFINKYNECVTGKSTATQQGSGIRVSVGPIVGGGTSNVTLNADTEKNNSDHYSGSYGSSTNVFGGISIELISKNRSGRNRAGLQFVFTKYSAVAHSWSTQYIQENYTLKLTTFDVGGTYRFIFNPGKKVTPFVKAEFNLTFVPNSSADYTRWLATTNQTTSGEYTRVDSKGLSFAPAIGIVAYERLSIELRYKFTSLATELGSPLLIPGPQLALCYMPLK